MGIYDRDYYRESGSRWSSLGDRPVTIGIILVCALAFIFQIATNNREARTDLLAQWGEFYFPAIARGEFWRLLTQHFLHDSTTLWHIVLNMFVLYWVGSELESIYGSREFLGFYLVTALLISLGKVVLAVVGLSNPEIRSLGASGPVNAVFVLYACHFPYRQVLLFFIIPAPVWLVAIGLFAIDLLGFVGLGRDGIGYTAHLLGAIFGYGYYRIGFRVTNWLPSMGRPPRLRSAPAPRLYREPLMDEVEVTTPTPPSQQASSVKKTSTKSMDEQLEAKLDLVLEKVSRFGRDSLTGEERDLLMRASEIYKRRRGH